VGGELFDFAAEGLDRGLGEGHLELRPEISLSLTTEEATYCALTAFVLGEFDQPDAARFGSYRDHSCFLVQR
jgi:hypothetical protein